MPDQPLKTTILDPAHRALKARMVAFAGYDMPVQYEMGVLKEHLWTREHAGAFDVSHMGPCFLDLAISGGDPEERHQTVASLIEPLVSGDIAGLKPGQLRYTLLLNEEGGILDDLMIGRPSDPNFQGRLYIVVNAGTKETDLELIAEAAGRAARLSRADDGGLIAVQGPDAADVVGKLFPQSRSLSFMTFERMPMEKRTVRVSRSGYTGEDGFELLAPTTAADDLWQRLLQDDRVRPIGLGARDSLRLEAGLPLYGHDLDPTVSPVEAGLAFAVSKKRLKAGAVRGAERIRAELDGGATRVRVGLKVLEGAPAREGAQIVQAGSAHLGQVTSGGFSPSLGYPIAMGFVPPAWSSPGTQLTVEVRGRGQAAEVVALPFVPHRYRRAA
ncbi:MAG TPA: glycine cleavage system aminomethyltransferase GcvT [Caulobacteraceae bacterium]